jgi:6-phosphogluconolactonase/glucosamine-6-phosphate isomerase/deaminase
MQHHLAIGYEYEFKNKRALATGDTGKRIYMGFVHHNNETTHIFAKFVDEHVFSESVKDSCLFLYQPE